MLRQWGEKWTEGWYIIWSTWLVSTNGLKHYTEPTRTNKSALLIYLRTSALIFNQTIELLTFLGCLFLWQRAVCVQLSGFGAFVLCDQNKGWPIMIIRQNKSTTVTLTIGWGMHIFVHLTRNIWAQTSTPWHQEVVTPPTPILIAKFYGDYTIYLLHWFN